MKFSKIDTLYTKKYFLGFIFSITFSLIMGQTENNKLLAIIKKSNKDTTTVLAFLQYGKILSNENADSSKLYYEKAYLLSKELNFKNGISQYYSNMIFLLRSRIGNRPQALELAKEFEIFAKKENNQDFLAAAYSSIGSTFQLLEKSDSAIFYFQKSLHILEKSNSTSLLPSIYGTLSRIYNEEKMNSIALQYLNKAIELNSQKKDTSALIINYINKSKLSYDIKDKIAEEKSNNEGLRLAIMSNNNYMQISIYTNIAAMYEDRHQLDSSLYYNKKAYAYSINYGAPYKAINPLIGIVACYAKQNNLSEANKYLQIIDQNPAIHQITLEEKALILEQKIKVYNGLGKYQDASELFDSYRALNDSTSTIATKKLLLEFDNKLKNVEREKAYMVKEIKISKQKSWIQGLTFLVLLFLLMGLFYYRYQTKSQESKNHKIKLLEQENKFIAEKSSLEGQLIERDRISKEIHDDLGSSLTTISLLSEVLKSKVDADQIPEVNKISSTASRMVDAMNEIVWALNIQNDTLGSLAAFIRKYARDFLQDTKIRFVYEEQPMHDISLKGQIRRSIYLVVKEALNNVVKHADASRVDLKILANKNELVVTIRDDGKGISYDKESISGNGLRNMRQRMEDIGGNFQILNDNGTNIIIKY